MCFFCFKIKKVMLNILILSFVFFSAQVVPNQKTSSFLFAQKINNLFEKHDYVSVSKMIQESSNYQLNIEILRPWAQEGLVPAMWILADQLHQNNDEKDSANWLYTAVLGLRMDISICLNNDTKNIESEFLNNYWSTVQSARVMPYRMATAIDFSIQFFKKNNLKTLDSSWACRLKPTWGDQGLIGTPQLNAYHRQWVFDNYIKSSSASKPSANIGQSSEIESILDH